MATEISQLRTRIHVNELASLSKASDRLNIAQPALSRQVRMLEDELGVRLFERHGRGMVTTEAGQDVIRNAYRVLGELEEIRACVADDAPLRGHVSIGMPPTVADILTEPLVKVFAQRHPDATLRTVSAYSAYLLDWLQRGDVDVAILFETKSAHTLRSQHLLEEMLHLIGPALAKLDPLKPVRFADLADQRLLLPRGGHGLRKSLEDSSSSAGFQLNVTVEADSYSTLKDLVKSGHGMTILPIAPIHRDIQSGELTHAPLINPSPIRRLMMSYPADRATPRLAKFAGAMLTQSARDLGESGVWSGHFNSEHSSKDVGVA
ncbi:MAG: LysR substrate-binding domain-containing protein [Sedimentitalea sp.]